MTTKRPRLQMGLITSVGLLWFLITIRYPSLVDRKMMALVKCARVYTVGAMLCGCLAAHINDADSKLPMWALCIWTILVLLGGSIVTWRIPGIGSELRVAMLRQFEI